MVKERLTKWMKDKGVSAKNLATEIGVQPSAISHILSGRNKPGFDFIEKLIRSFPDLDLNWLISGIEDNVKPDHREEVVEHDESASKKDRGAVRRIVIFYADGTFEDYVAV